MKGLCQVQAGLTAAQDGKSPDGFGAAGVRIRPHDASIPGERGELRLKPFLANLEVGLRIKGC